ncbi:MAG: acyl-CoA dehydrogenase, partial [Cytophagia bacterium]|nr:acyl-CoA dehydrogenase [Cytophagia bacterium]
CKDYIAMTQIYMSQAVEKINAAAKEAIGSFTKGDEQKVMLMGLKRFTKMDLVNVKELRRQVADTMIAKGKYPYFFG